MRESFTRHPFPAAREAVDRATRSSGLISCLLFGFIFAGVLAAVAGLIAAVLLLDYGGEYVGVAAVAVIVVLAIPLIVHFTRTARKARTTLEGLGCPRCGRPNELGVDGGTNHYQLICDGCRVVWLTGVAAPGSDHDHGHHHHHHH